MKISRQRPTCHTIPFPGLPGFHTAMLCLPSWHTLLLASPAKFPTCGDAAHCALCSHWLACVLISCNEVFLPTQSLKLVETINYFFSEEPPNSYSNEPQDAHPGQKAMMGALPSAAWVLPSQSTIQQDVRAQLHSCFRWEVFHLVSAGLQELVPITPAI